MLFNSFPFLFTYLPILIIGFYFLTRFCPQLIIPWLTIGSLFFYGWWSPKCLILLCCSILFNFIVANKIINHQDIFKRKFFLILGVLVNLSGLIFFKYLLFFVENLNYLLKTHFNLFHIILPLGISFFTFTQIAFLVDVYYKRAQKTNLIEYSLFVTYFPHLIAGPIIHHKKTIPQFNKFRSLDKTQLIQFFCVGLSIFIIGLFKKVCIADSLSPIVDKAFGLCAHNFNLPKLDAWVGAFSYTFQLYFDFSGYSDMAVGLSCMLGVKIPINFNSPYKAVNIIDFWRRWHISLSTFFRDYLYIPLGGNRKGKRRQLINVGVVMLLVGFWHGAGWTFIVWGGYHGTLLIVNHLWIAEKRQYEEFFYKVNKYCGTWVKKIFTQGTTFLLVVIGWVLFRSDNLSAAHHMLSSMFFHADNTLHIAHTLRYYLFCLFVLFCFMACISTRNSSETMGLSNTFSKNNGSNSLALQWSPSIKSAILLGGVLYLSLSSMIHSSSKFLYFNF